MQMIVSQVWQFTNFSAVQWVKIGNCQSQRWHDNSRLAVWRVHSLRHETCITCQLRWAADAGWCYSRWDFYCVFGNEAFVYCLPVSFVSMNVLGVPLRGEAIQQRINTIHQWVLNTLILFIYLFFSAGSLISARYTDDVRSTHCMRCSIHVEIKKQKMASIVRSKCKERRERRRDKKSPQQSK